MLRNIREEKSLIAHKNSTINPKENKDIIIVDQKFDHMVHGDQHKVAIRVT